MGWYVTGVLGSDKICIENVYGNKLMRFNYYLNEANNLGIFFREHKCGIDRIKAGLMLLATRLYINCKLYGYLKMFISKIDNNFTSRGAF